MTTPLIDVPGLSTAPLAYTGLRVAAGPEQGRDLYEIWNSVFDRRGSGDSLPESDSAADGSDSDPDRGARSAGAPGSNTDAHDGTALEPQIGAAPINSAKGTAMPVSSLGDRTGSSGASTNRVPPGQDEAAVDVMLLSQQPPDRSEGSETDTYTEHSSAASEAGQTSWPQARPTPESVSVVVNGSRVSIVVRDTRLAPPAALQSAFEATERLTGQRGSLQRFTLNGRTLYQQEAAAEKHAAPAFLFAC